MAVRRVLTRLLRLRELEEEQSRLELEAAVAARGRVEAEREIARLRQAAGRRTFVREIAAMDTAGRNGGVIEMEQARRQRLVLEPKLEAAKDEVSRQREGFLVRRMARRQVETLVDQERGAAEVAAGRRAQQILDDWHGRKGRHEGREGKSG